MKNDNINNGLSIITIVYNGQEEIEETIESVITQNTIPLEYIIIDGNSTDNTLSIINKYKNQITHIISEQDNGIYDAINKGIALCTYSLIGIIHCGDRYTSNTLETVYFRFLDTDADIIYGDMILMSIIDNGKSKYQRMKANHNYLNSYMSIYHPATFIKRNIYITNIRYNTYYKIAADYDLLLSLYQNNYSFDYIPQPLAIFRSGGISSTNEKLLLLENFTIRLKRMGFKSALLYLATTGLRMYYYIYRKKIIMMVLGEYRFEEIKMKYNKDKSRNY